MQGNRTFTTEYTAIPSTSARISAEGNETDIEFEFSEESVPSDVPEDILLSDPESDTGVMSGADPGVGSGTGSSVATGVEVPSEAGPGVFSERESDVMFGVEVRGAAVSKVASEVNSEAESWRLPIWSRDSEVSPVPSLVIAKAETCICDKHMARIRTITSHLLENIINFLLRG